MNRAEKRLVREGRALGHAKDAKHLIRPGELVARDVQMPASDVRDFLRSVQVGLTLSQRFFSSFALGDVADVPGELRRTGRGDARDRELDGKFLAARSNRRQFDAATENLGHARGEVSGQPLPVAVAQRRRDDDIRDLTAKDILPAMAEHLLGGRVELRDAASRVNGDDGIERSLHGGRVACFAASDLGFGPLVLGDIMDGAAHEHDPAAGIALRFATARDRSDRAIGANHLQLELERRPRLDGPFHRGGQSREAVRRVETGVLLEARRRHLRIAAGNAIQPFRPRDGVGRGIPPPTAHPRQTLRLSQLLLASMQRPFRVSAFRVAAIDALAAPDRQTGQQRDHRDDHHRDPAPLGEQAGGIGLPRRGAYQQRNDDGRGPQPSGEHAAVTRTGEQRTEPPARARTRHSEGQHKQGDGRLQRNVGVGGVRPENEVQEPDDGARVGREGQELRRLIAPRPVHDRPVQPQQREPNQKEIQRGNRCHQARTNASERLPGVLIEEEQLIDAKVPADEVLRQAQQTHQCDDRRQHLTGELPDCLWGLRVLAPQQPQRTATQHESDGGVRLDDHLPWDDALQDRDAERPADQTEQSDRDRKETGERDEAVQAPHHVSVRHRDHGPSGGR